MEKGNFFFVAFKRKDDKRRWHEKYVRDGDRELIHWSKVFR